MSCCYEQGKNTGGIFIPEVKHTHSQLIVHEEIGYFTVCVYRSHIGQRWAPYLFVTVMEIYDSNTELFQLKRIKVQCDLCYSTEL
jgi:hypothetical protein